MWRVQKGCTRDCDVALLCRMVPHKPQPPTQPSQTLQRALHSQQLQTQLLSQKSQVQQARKTSPPRTQRLQAVRVVPRAQAGLQASVRWVVVTRTPSPPSLARRLAVLVGAVGSVRSRPRAAGLEGSAAPQLPQVRHTQTHARTHAHITYCFA